MLDRCISIAAYIAFCIISVGLWFVEVLDFTIGKLYQCKTYLLDKTRRAWFTRNSTK